MFAGRRRLCNLGPCRQKNAVKVCVCVCVRCPPPQPVTVTALLALLWYLIIYIDGPRSKAKEASMTLRRLLRTSMTKPQGYPAFLLYSLAQSESTFRPLSFPNFFLVPQLTDVEWERNRSSCNRRCQNQLAKRGSLSKEHALCLWAPF